MTRHAILISMTLVAVVTPLRAEKPTKAEIGKRGKAATALAIVPGRGSGTAFCVHPSGLFITNEHVIRGQDKAEIKLVVDASLATQRVLPATVVRADKELDLALLRVAIKDEMPTLPLGSVEGVTELMDVVVFGFPLGIALSADRHEYPSISVNAGNVSSLRRKGGEIDRIQVDVSVTFGSSGGPVLDENGKVVGVVVSGVPGQRGINLAIPVSHVARFLSAPAIQLTAPELTQATLDKLQEFRAQVVSVVPGAKEPSVRLVLRAGSEPAREFPMIKRDGGFVATVVPLPKSGNRQVEVSIRFGMGMISGLTNDMVLKVGGKPMRLSGLTRIELKPKPLVVLPSGAVVEGEVAGLGPVDVLIGDQKVNFDLQRAVQVQVTPAAGVAVVLATVIASVDGKDIGQIEVPISVRDSGAIVSADPSSVVITPPALAENQVIKRLPEPFDDVLVGGGGRFLIFHLPKLRKLAVFDVNEARVTNYIPAFDDKATFAASLDKVVVGLPESKTLERWSLTTFERELSVETTFPIGSIAMGHASNGPVIMNGMFLDLTTLRPLPISAPKFERPYVSADGTVFTVWNPDSVSGGRSHLWVLQGNEIKHLQAGEFGHLLPGTDGRTLFTAKGLVMGNFKQLPDDTRYGYCVPAVRGNFFLSLTPSDKMKSGSFIVYVLGQSAPIAKLPELLHGLTFTHMDHGAIGAWNRVYFIPQANVIVVLPDSNDRLVLYKFDLDEALEKSGLDYLVVTSPPPPSAKRGAKFNYPIVVKSKNKDVTFKLDSGPKGMSVSKTGVVEWNVPLQAQDGEQEVIMTIGDGKGQEIFHTFTVRVVK